MTEEEILRKAKEAGFDSAEIIDTNELHFDSSLRKYCQDNYCGNYGANYSCPPECGTPEEMKGRALQYQKVLVLQTLTPVKDMTDSRETGEIKHRHNQMTWGLIDNLSGRMSPFLPVLAGPCGICKVCEKKMGNPCRQPEKKAACVSAYCILVADLASRCHMAYWCQEEVAFFSLLFFLPKTTKPGTKE